MALAALAASQVLSHAQPAGAEATQGDLVAAPGAPGAAAELPASTRLVQHGGLLTQEGVSRGIGAAEIARHFSSLWGQAIRGDRGSAVILATVLRDCPTAPVTEPERDRLLVLVRVDGSAVVDRAVRDGIRQEFERCRHFSDYQRGLAYDALVLAARAGDLMSQFIYAETQAPDSVALHWIDRLQVNHRRELDASDLLQRSLNDGEAGALPMLAGVLTRLAAQDARHAEDAYAFSFAAAIREEAAPAPVFRRDWNEPLSRLREFLTAEQQARAEARALAMVEGLSR
jgi:hypothetical protein